MGEATELIKAITGLAWPIIVGLVIWRLFPSIKQIVESRGFTVKVGNAELTVQQISEKLLETTANLQGKLATMSTVDERSGNRLAAEPGERKLRKVLWVDDHPENNVYEVAQLERLGVQVDQAASTIEGVAALLYAEPAYNAVISDLSRREGRNQNPEAGLDLIRQVRAQGSDVPVFIYASTRGVRKRAEVESVGGNGVARTSTELFAFLRTVGSFPNGD